MSEEVTYRWELHLAADPASLWPLVADTNRFDRDAGTPPVERMTERDAELQNARCAVRQRLFGVTLQYEQEPFEWTFPDEFSVTRNYSKGPLASLAVHGWLRADGTGGTHCTYEVRVRPRNVLGRAAIPIQIGVLYKRTFLSTFRRYDELVRAGTTWATTARPPRLSRDAELRLRRAVEQLGDGDGSGEDADTRGDVELLARYLRDADDDAVARIRPYAVADSWGRSRRDVLELFLRATRAGLVGFRWDVLCPRCGVAKASVPHLDELPREVHCPTCNIDYEANFARSVELAFRVSPAIRPVSSDEYCIGAPMATPHVVAQVLVAPGARVSIQPQLAPGRHRIRCYELPGSFSVVGVDGAAHTLDLTLSSRGWPDTEPTLGLHPTLDILNATDQEELVLVERTAWNDQAVTAAEVTALQEFRDLFASEALRPGEQISVGSLAVVFTDLRSSTQLYRRIGDAVAFGHVLNHFDVLRAAVTHWDGTIVKTIGDAVMAVFATPAQAVQAMVEAEEGVRTLGPSGDPFRLKVGVHYGPCIAVTLNGALDYFGTTVNLAARLEGLSNGADLVLSDEVRTDPEVAALVDAPGLVCTTEEAQVKGFGEPIRIHRLTRNPIGP